MHQRTQLIRLNNKQRFVLRALAQEALIVFNCANIMDRHEQLSDVDYGRLVCAASRILRATEWLTGASHHDTYHHLLFRALVQEALVVYNCASILANRRKLRPADRERLLLAVSRILQAGEALHAV